MGALLYDLLWDFIAIMIYAAVGVLALGAVLLGLLLILSFIMKLIKPNL